MSGRNYQILNKMEKELQELNSLVQVIREKMKAFEKMSVLYDISPKFSLDQKVWILKDCPSWYDMPVEFGLESAFEEETIYRIVFSKRSDSNTSRCCTGTQAKQDEIVVSYHFGNFSDSNKELEENVWGSLKEAMNINKEKFSAEKKKYTENLEKERQEKKKRLQEEINKLSSQKT